jgi:replicative DNA helicase
VSDERGGAAVGGPDFERTPPQDIAAEQCVLGGMMLSKDATPTLSRCCAGTTSTSPRNCCLRHDH